MKYPTALRICWWISVALFYIGLLFFEYKGTLMAIGAYGMWICVPCWLYINRNNLWKRYPLPSETKGTQ